MRRDYNAKPSEREAKPSRATLVAPRVHRGEFAVDFALLKLVFDLGLEPLSVVECLL